MGRIPPLPPAQPVLGGSSFPACTWRCMGLPLHHPPHLLPVLRSHFSGEREAWVWGICGLLVGWCLDSLVQCCWWKCHRPVMLERGWGASGLWWGMVPALGSKRCVNTVALGSCFVSVLLNACDGPRQSQQQVSVSAPWAVLSQSLDLDLHFTATDVRPWTFSQRVAALGSAEPSLSCFGSC